jgi:hypothetical protein
MEFEGQKTVAEIRIIAYYAKPDDEEKFYYAGALSGKLDTPSSTYGTVSDIKHKLEFESHMACRFGPMGTSALESQTLSTPI